MVDQPIINYAVQPILDTVTIQSSPERTVITLRPSARRVSLACLTALWSPLVIAVTLFLVFFLRDWRTISWTGLIAPIVFCALTFVAGLTGVFPNFFAKSVELDAQILTLKWRTPTELKSLVWQRSAILAVRADRLRIKGRIRKAYGLVLQHRDMGNVIVLNGSTAEIELISETIRGVLGLPAAQNPAMSLPMPPRCAFKRFAWSQGVSIGIAPRHRMLLGAIITTCSMVLSTWGVYAYMQRVGAGFLLTINVLIPLGVFTGLIAGLLASYMLAKARKTTAIYCTPANLQVIESGFISPLNVNLLAAQVQSVEACLNPKRPTRASLQINLTNSPPLFTAMGHKRRDIEWLVEVLNLARRAPAQTAPVANAIPGAIK